MPAAPKLTLGTSVDGLTYLGGDPKQQENWLDLDKMAASGLTGQPLLDQLQATHPALVPSIKAFSEGRMQLPQNRVMTDPYWSNVFRISQMYDPTLDQSTYPRRVQTAKAFAPGGEAAMNLRNLNQAIGHASELADNINGVAGHQGLLGLAHALNWAENSYAQGAGDPGISAYAIPHTALSSELASVFKGKGSSSEQEINKFYDMLSQNNSTAQKQAGIKGLMGLLKSRVDELGDQYNEGFSTKRDSLSLLNPNAQSQYNKLSTLGGTPSSDQSVDPQTQALFQKYGVNSGSP